MNIPNGNGSTADKIAESAYTKLVARLAMIVAAALLPVAGWFLIQTYSKVDTIAGAIIKTETRLDGHDRDIDRLDTRLGAIESRRSFGP